MMKIPDSHRCMVIITAVFISLSTAEVLIRAQWPVPLFFLLISAQASVLLLGWYRRSTLEMLGPLAFIQVLIAFLVVHSAPAAGGPLTLVLAQLALPGFQALKGRTVMAVGTTAALIWVGTIDPVHDLWFPHLPSALVWAVLFAFSILLGRSNRLKAEQRSAQAESSREELKRRRLELAHHLHRSVARELTFTVMKAQEINERQDLPGVLKSQLQDVEASARHALMQTHELLDGLKAVADTDPIRPLVPRPVGMVLQSVGADLEDLGFTVELATPHSCDVIPTKQVAPLITVLEEASGNIAKYADPSLPVRLELRITDQETLLRIGNSVQQGVSTLSPVASSGIGLSHMRHAVESVGGDFAVERSASDWAVVVSLKQQKTGPSGSSAESRL